MGTYLDIHRDVHSSALLVFDLDNFKQVNDRRGHLAGDAVLMAFANLLRSCSRARDFAARVGGDEFLLFMQDVPSHEDAAGMAERVRAAMREGLGAEYADCGLSVSIGVAFSQEKGLAYDAFFRLPMTTCTV
ncbi:MAG: GGDEF domain-containing protein [Bilophila sp.]